MIFSGITAYWNSTQYHAYDTIILALNALSVESVDFDLDDFENAYSDYVLSLQTFIIFINLIIIYFVTVSIF